MMQFAITSIHVFIYCVSCSSTSQIVIVNFEYPINDCPTEKRKHKFTDFHIGFSFPEFFSLISTVNS